MKRLLVDSIVCFIILILITTILFYNDKSVNKSEHIYDIKNNMLSIIFETSAGSGDYENSDGQPFPTSRYKFNVEKNGCKNSRVLERNPYRVS